MKISFSWGFNQHKGVYAWLFSEVLLGLGIYSPKLKHTELNLTGPKMFRVIL